MLKKVGLILVGLVVVGVMVIALGVGAMYALSSAAFSQTYSVEPAALTIPTDADTIAQGKRLAAVHGCQDCHGKDMAGAVVMDSGVTGVFAGPNLTPGGVGKNYTDADWVRSIRHGIVPSGRSVLFMPSEEYYFLSDADLAAIIAYLKSLPAVDKTMPAVAPGPLMRGLYLSGQLQLVKAEIINQTAPRPSPPAGPTVEYGQYLVITTCQGCHGEGLSGGPIPGADPSWPPASNLTLDKATGLGEWTEADFVKAMQQGQRPNGEIINPVMPWPNFAQFTAEELTALWLYIQSLPPKAEGNR